MTGLKAWPLEKTNLHKTTWDRPPKTQNVIVQQQQEEIRAQIISHAVIPPPPPPPPPLPSDPPHFLLSSLAPIDTVVNKNTTAAIPFPLLLVCASSLVVIFGMLFKIIMQQKSLIRAISRNQT
jgi:hypothetical protein